MFTDLRDLFVLDVLRLPADVHRASQQLIDGNTRLDVCQSEELLVVNGSELDLMLAEAVVSGVRPNAYVVTVVM